MPGRKRRVMVFGTFDVVHEGHRSLFRQAREHGEELIVVVARDATVRRVKGRPPHHGEAERKAAVEEEGLADRVVLGDPADSYAVIERFRPDVICLGYDQSAFVDSLPEELRKRGLSAAIVRLAPFRPEVFKSSKIKEQHARQGTTPPRRHPSPR